MDSVEIAVQLNGKVRARLTVASGLDEAATEAAARAEIESRHPELAGTPEARQIGDAIAIGALRYFLLRFTRWGAYIYAVGDNPFAARVTGIPSRPIVVLQYVLAALIGCFAGLVMAASVNSMPTRIFNSTLIYDVILVVVLGGIGLSGGRGGVVNVIIGTLLIGTMLNGMTILDIPYAGQNLIKGIVLLIAVITDTFLNPRNEETAQQGDI